MTWSPLSQESLFPEVQSPLGHVWSHEQGKVSAWLEIVSKKSQEHMLWRHRTSVRPEGSSSRGWLGRAAQNVSPKDQKGGNRSWRLTGWELPSLQWRGLELARVCLGAPGRTWVRLEAGVAERRFTLHHFLTEGWGPTLEQNKSLRTKARRRAQGKDVGSALSEVMLSPLSLKIAE